MRTEVSRESSLYNALENLRYEVVPVSSVHDEVRYLPEGARVTITTSARLGLERTVRVAEALSAEGYAAVPHLTARRIEDAGQLANIVERLRNAGVQQILALGGDADPPAGEFASSLELIQAIERIGNPFLEIGVAGYPEGHPAVPQNEMLSALAEKAEYADHIVTQMCFSAEAIRTWLEEIRARGIKLPVYIGIPGKVSQKRLLSMAPRIGVGDSLRFLRKNPLNLAKMMLSFAYDPKDLVYDLAPLLTDEFSVVGFHVYTFNEISATEQWRLDQIGRLAEER